MQSPNSSVRFFFLEVHGEQAISAATDALGRFMGSSFPALPAAEPTVAALPPSEAVAVAEEPPRQPRRIIRRKRAAKYEKPADEPDGFNLPAPDPTKATAVDRGGAPSRKFNRPPEDKVPVALASQIISVLDSGAGVAPLEYLVRETGKGAQAVNMAITKCDRLKRMPDGRIALAGYKDED